jgi:hypothetical protein
MLTIKKTASFTSSDGTVFTKREQALAHEKFLVRKKKLEAIQFIGFVQDDRSNYVVGETDMPEFIAKHADQILAALTVTQARAPRRPKTVPVVTQQKAA